MNPIALSGVRSQPLLRMTGELEEITLQSIWLYIAVAFQFPQYYYREFFKRRIREHFKAAVRNNDISEAEFHAVTVVFPAFLVFDIMRFCRHIVN